MFNVMYALVLSVITGALLTTFVSDHGKKAVVSSIMPSDQCTETAAQSASSNPNKIRFISCGGFL